MHLFMMLLGLMFIGLKLAGVIAWSWLWVLAPFWIGAVTGFLILLVLVCIGGLSNASFNRRF